MTPLAERVEDIAAGVLESVSHYLEPILCRQSVRLKTSTIIVLEVIDTPGGIRIRIKLFIAVASWIESTIVYAGITT